MSLNDLPIASVRFALDHQTVVHASPLSRTEQVHDYGNARWSATISAPPMRRSAARDWIAWMAEQRGVSGEFDLSDPAYLCVAPDVAGVTLAATAVRGATSITLSGLPAVDTLAAGGHVELNGQLLMITAAPTDAGGGDVSMSVEPPLRVTAASGNPVDVATPVCTMRLADDLQAKWTVDRGRIYSVSVAAVEVLKPLTAQDAYLFVAAGAYEITGNDVDLLRYSISVVAGSYAITGGAVAIRRRLEVRPGAYVISPGTIQLTV